MNRAQIHFGINVPERQIPGVIGWTIHQTQDSVFWIGCGRNGGMLFKLFETTPQLINYDINGLSVYSFLENNLSSRNEVWMGTDDGIVLFDLTEGANKYFSQDLLFPGSEESIIIHSLRMSPDFILWAACLSKNEKKLNGLLKLDPSKQQFKFYSIPVDPMDTIDKLKIFYKTTSFFDNGISDLEFDPSGRLLVTTFGIGLYLFDPQKEKFGQYPHSRVIISKSSYIRLIQESQWYNLYYRMATEIPLTYWLRS